MQFGITLKPDISVDRIVGLTRQAEAAGFEYGWLFDSHVLWMGPLPSADADGGEHEEDEAWHASDKPAGSRSHGDFQFVCHTESDFRRQNGIRHRTRRQFQTSAGQETGQWSQLETAVKIFRDLTASREIEYERSAHAPYLGQRFSAGLDRGLWTEGVAHGRSRRRRNHSSICRS